MKSFLSLMGKHREQGVVEVHTHHWVLASDVTREVPARCRDCGAERTFKGYRDMDAGTAKRRVM